MLLKESITEYLAARRVEGCSEQTLGNLEVRLTQFMKFLSNKRIHRVTDIRAGHVDDYAADLVQRRAKHGTRCAYMSTLRVFFRWLQARGKVLVNPARDVVIPDADEEPLPEQPMSETEVSAIMERRLLR